MASPDPTPHQQRPLPSATHQPSAISHQPSSPLPPDRSHIATEGRNPRTADLHRLSAADCVRRIHAEDRTVSDALERSQPALIAFIEAAAPGFLRGGRLIYLGAGTSGRLGVLDASEAPPTFQVPLDRIIGLIAGGDAALRRSSEGLEDDPAGALPELAALALTADDTVLGIAAGGTTPYVIGALRWIATSPGVRGPGSGVEGRDPSSIDADDQRSDQTSAAARPAEWPDQRSDQAVARRRPLTALLSCSPIPCPPGVDHLIVFDTGPEVLTGSTRMKAGTATKLALNTISTTVMALSGKVYGNLMVDVRATNAKLRDRAARIIGQLTGLDREACFALLDRAGGAAKTAVAMHAKGLDRAAAEAALAAVGGRLDHVIG